jgi:hypothetical protein
MRQIELHEDVAPSVIVEHVGGDLRVRGWARQAVTAHDDETALNQDEQGTVVAGSGGDMDLSAPYETDITVSSIGGDARLTSVSGVISAQAVGGDLALRKTGPITVGSVGGDLRIKRTLGDVRIQSVGSDATIREVEGHTAIVNVGSDLYVRDVQGGCEVDNVGSDLVLSTDFVPGAVYRFNVGGDIVCRIPPEADVRVRVLDCEDLSIDAADAELVEGEDADEVVFGNGAALVELQAGGDIRLVTQGEDYIMAINVQLEEELTERLSGLEERLSEQLAGLDDLLAEKADRIREKAEKQAERALRQAEKVARKAERNVGKRKRGFTLSFGGPGAPRSARPARPPEPREPVSDEERLTILRMVEAKQITVEEAEKLLAALEGGD